MRMQKYMQDIYEVLTNDETLLRLLYYKPDPYKINDDPLDPSKPDILSMDNKWEIIKNRIKFTKKVDDLTTEPICRILFFPGKRRSSNGNYLRSKQKIIFDIFTQHEYQDVDLRLEKILDHLNDMISTNKITGVGKIIFDDGGELNGVPEGYFGYRLVYTFGSVN